MRDREKDRERERERERKRKTERERKREREREDFLGGPTFHVIVLDRCAAVGRLLHLRAIALLRDDAPTWSTQSVSVNRHWLRWI